MRTPLPRQAAGLLHILPPARFTVIVQVPHVVSVVTACVLQTTVTATMTSSTMVNITGTGATTSTGSTPPLRTAPMGAVNTGGGGSLRHANVLPMLAAGITVALAGAGITIIGLRRRRRNFSA